MKEFKYPIYSINITYKRYEEYAEMASEHNAKANTLEREYEELKSRALKLAQERAKYAARHLYAHQKFVKMTYGSSIHLSICHYANRRYCRQVSLGEVIGSLPDKYNNCCSYCLPDMYINHQI